MDRQEQSINQGFPRISYRNRRHDRQPQYRQRSRSPPIVAQSLFGSSSGNSGGLFGGATQQIQERIVPVQGLFGPPLGNSGGLFGGVTTTTQQIQQRIVPVQGLFGPPLGNSGGLFGGVTTTTQQIQERIVPVQGLFGPPSGNGMLPSFGSSGNSEAKVSNLFGSPQPTRSIFENSSNLATGFLSTMNQQTTLFTNKYSPWFHSPQSVKLLFDQQKVSNNLVIFPTALPEKYSKKLSTLNSCTSKDPSKRYYQCFECCGGSYVICESCFKEEDHQGHYYEFCSIHYNLDLKFCVCGKDHLKFSKNKVVITCDKHCRESAPDEDLQYDRNQFINYYGSLLAIGIYTFVENRRRNKNPQEEKMFLEMLIQHLSKLAIGSSQNIRVITEMLSFPLKSKFFLNEGQTIQFFSIDKSLLDEERPVITYLLHKELSESFSPLLEELLSDDPSAKKIIQIMKIEETKLLNNEGQRLNLPQFAYMGVTFRQSLIQELLNNKLFYHINERSAVRFVEATNSHYQQLIEYINFVSQSKQSGMTNNKRKEFISRHFRMSRTLKQLCPYMLSNFLREFTFSINHNLDTSMLQIIISKFIISFCECKVEKIRDFRLLFRQSMKFDAKVSESKQQQYAETMAHLETFVEWGIQHFKNIQGDIRHSRMIAFQYLALKSSRKDVHFFRITTYCLNNMNIILMFIRLGMWKLYLKGIDLPLLAEEREQNIEYRQKKLIQHLYEIKKYDIGLLCHYQKFFEVPTFSTVVQEYLNYDNESKMFFYNQKEKHPNKLMNLFHKQIFNEECFFNRSDTNIFDEYFENPATKELFEELFINSDILQRSKKFNMSSLLSESQKPPEQQFHHAHLQLSVIIDLISKGSNQLATKEMMRIKNDAESLEIKNERNISMINEVLCTNQDEKREQMSTSKNQKPQKEEIIEERSESFLEQAKLKKAEKFSKFKEKQKVAVQKHSLNELSRVPSSDEGQSCLICKEKGRKDNGLIYLAHISSGKSFSSFFGEIDKMRTNISSCFHPIHVECFFQKYSLRGLFNCILCGKSANCIVPEIYDSTHVKINQICENALIITFYCSDSTLETSSMFSFFFKHLIESKLFVSLTNIHQRQKSKKRKLKVNQYIENSLDLMYSGASSDQKQEYDQFMSQLLDEVKKNERNDILIQLQQMFIVMLCEKIKTGKTVFRAQWLETISRELCEKQFKIILEEICDLEAEFEMENTLASLQGHGTVEYEKHFPIRPPLTVGQIRSFGDSYCVYCKQKEKNRVCLICGSVLCNNCEGSSLHSHGENILFLSIPETCLYAKNQRISIYFNYVMTPFENRSEENRRDIFYLNQEIFQQVCDSMLKF